AQTSNSIGVEIEGNSNPSTIGAPGHGNVISNNGQAGVDLAGSCCTAVPDLIQSNRIGTNPQGTSAVPNQVGIALGNRGNVTVGGTSAGTGNLVSGNIESGIFLDEDSPPPVALGDVIEGNLIGTDATGSAAVPNGTSNQTNLNAGIFVHS